MKYDYTVRLTLKLTDAIDPDMLRDAVDKTSQRYPYLSVRMKKNAAEFFYEENREPITIHNTDSSITLNAAETNYHSWAVCYNEDRLHLDFSHNLCDGGGIDRLLATLLFYYFHECSGVTDHTGILTLDDPILPEESIDLFDSLPRLSPELMTPPAIPEVFSVIKDGGLTPSENYGHL